ncbi:hypothetical protein AMA11_22975 [Salmonella enterica subsp. enterica serovar Muenchen]|nr:hypothetical protein [Salmonella enterica subsp. enterica serovar Muenchen]ECD1912757.1 hypothetical protein [Salmonella enterica subsp. enterica serovar Bovismorbificans]ECH8727004.1 hypothetical protein [Salmonella enterica subsp. enterica]EGI6305919.1 hypothetical protein [Salmonella enterica subsp. enterica serovar Hindmarsh]
MGAQKGAHEHTFLFISFIFNLLCCVLSPAFAPSDAIISYLRGAFFVSISVQIRPYPSVIQR